MKQRLITAGIGIAVLIITMLFFETLVFNLIIALISAMSVYELLVSTKLLKQKNLILISLIYSFAFPFISLDVVERFIPIGGFVLAFFYFLILIFDFKKTRLEELGLAFFISTLVPVSISTAVYIRAMFAPPVLSVFYILLALGSAWMTDAGAYFFGRALGKRKLAPEISPHKTIEGAVGGVLTNMVFFAIFPMCFNAYLGMYGMNISVNIFHLVLLAPVGSCLAIFGDLCASGVKRQTLIKDFSNLMPGHGGIADRFDSVFFVMPFIYLIAKYLNPVSLSFIAGLLQ